MPIRTFRFQADVGPDGQFVSAQLIDQIIYPDPVTGEDRQGDLLPPHVLTEADSTLAAVLFGALNTLVSHAETRLDARKAAWIVEKSGETTLEPKVDNG